MHFTETKCNKPYLAPSKFFEPAAGDHAGRLLIVIVADIGVDYV